ncbi:hypothetical protein BD413DRAFT_38089 [Trametes elegans]|nr:hypothetical protein BD413DRAFT_38089 [Trametes elegans]
MPAFVSLLVAQSPSLVSHSPLASSPRLDGFGSPDPLPRFVVHLSSIRSKATTINSTLWRVPVARPSKAVPVSPGHARWPNHGPFGGWIGCTILDGRGQVRKVLKRCRDELVKLWHDIIHLLPSSHNHSLDVSVKVSAMLCAMLATRKASCLNLSMTAKAWLRNIQRWMSE